MARDWSPTSRQTVAQRRSSQTIFLRRSKTWFDFHWASNFISVRPGEKYNRGLGAWTLAFQTGTPGGEVLRHIPPDCVSVYVPTTPNPTGGYFVIVRRADVIELDMSVDQALKYIISMGVVPPLPK